MTDEMNTTAASAGAQPILLNTSDLKNLLLLVDLASKRGAFQPREFAAIAEIYNRVDEFIAKTSPPETAPQATPTTGV